ncbi:zeta toxin family protein [Pseudoclavibacter sp. RFBB5]|uniref:zeta toxin family protein n=1 Tax=Pseudoclavibacter sp. RFBB5 TaxID=2080574 RepID=UPI0015E22BE1|nr:zeta toxin family protein [Pseudoclavibacter sp. RFBB5]
MSNEALEPTLVLVGAQPGAGKTRTVGRAQKEHVGSSAVVGDDLRVFHPDYVRLMREDPLRMPEVTAQAAGAWARMSSDYLRERQASVVFETTFRQPDAVVATAKEFRDAGYRVEVRALAVPEAVSRLGVLSRYAEQVRDQGVGRWTPQEFHDNAAEQMPKSLERVISEGYVDRALVVDRAGRALYAADIDAALASSPDARDGVHARTAVDNGRALENLDRASARSWLGTLDRDANDVLDRATLGRDVLSTIDDLRRDGARIAPLAHEPNSAAASTAAARLTALGDRTSQARDALERRTGHDQAAAAPTQQLQSQLTTTLDTTLGTSSRLQPEAVRTHTQQAAPVQER